MEQRRGKKKKRRTEGTSCSTWKFDNGSGERLKTRRKALTADRTRDVTQSSGHKNSLADSRLRNSCPFFAERIYSSTMRFSRETFCNKALQRKNFGKDDLIFLVMNLSRDIVQFTMTVTSNNDLLFLTLRIIFDKQKQLQK